MINTDILSFPTNLCKNLFPLPAKVEERLDKLRGNYLWLGNKQGKGIHLVKWQAKEIWWAGY